METLFGLACLFLGALLFALVIQRVLDVGGMRREVDALRSQVDHLTAQVDALRATRARSAEVPVPAAAPAPAVVPVPTEAVAPAPLPWQPEVDAAQPRATTVVPEVGPPPLLPDPEPVRAPAPAAPDVPVATDPIAPTTPPPLPAPPEPEAPRGPGWEVWLAANATGVAGALAVVLGVGFLTVNAALRMPPSGRFLLMELFAVGLFVGSVVLSRASWSRTLALTVRSAAAAVALLGCVASSTYSPIRWVEDPRLGLLLTVIGVVVNLGAGVRAGRQAFAAVHTVLSLAALAFSPADAASLAVAGLVAVLGGGLALRRPDWDAAVALGAVAWSVFHLQWWARCDPGMPFLTAHALPVALVVVVAGVGLAVSYVRVPTEPPTGASHPVRALLAHSTQWVLLGGNLVLHERGGWAGTVLLTALAATAWAASARAMRTGPDWLFRTDRLVSLALGLLATLSLGRRGLDASTVLFLLHLVPAAFVVLETRSRSRIVAAVASAALQLASLCLVVWVAARRGLTEIATTWDVPWLAFDGSPTWDAAVLTAAGVVVGATLLLSPTGDDDEPPELWLLSWAAPLLALAAGLRVSGHLVWGTLLGVLPLLAAVTLRTRLRHPLAGAATLVAAAALAGWHLLHASPTAVDGWEHLLPAVGLVAAAALAEGRSSRGLLVDAAHGTLLAIVLGLGTWTLWSGVRPGATDATELRWLLALVGAAVAVGALTFLPRAEPVKDEGDAGERTARGLDLSLAVLLATAVQVLVDPVSPARALGALAVVALLVGVRATVRRVDVESGHALGLLLMSLAIAPRVLHQPPTLGTVLLGVGTALALVGAALTPPPHARHGQLTRLPTVLAWFATLGLSWRLTVDTSSFLPGVLWIVFAVVQRTVAPAWRRWGGDRAADTLHALALTTFVVFAIRHGLVDLQHETRLGPVSLRGAIELYAAAVATWWALSPTSADERDGAWLLELAVGLVLLFVQLDVGPAWRAPVWLLLSVVLVEAGPRLAGHARVAGLGVLLYAAVLLRVALLSSRLISPEVSPLLPPWLVALATLVAALGVFVRFRMLAPTLRTLPVTWEGHVTALAARDPVKVLLWPWFAAAAVYLAWVFDAALLTVSWGALALGLFAAALALRDRPSRRLALVALVVVLVRLVVVDLRGTDVFVKALVFLGIGGVLLAVSLLASRFLDRFDPPEGRT